MLGIGRFYRVVNRSLLKVVHRKELRNIPGTKFKEIPGVAPGPMFCVGTGTYVLYIYIYIPNICYNICR